MLGQSSPVRVATVHTNFVPVHCTNHQHAQIRLNKKSRFTKYSFLGGNGYPVDRTSDGPKPVF
jgi:hypothetical protein